MSHNTKSEDGSAGAYILQKTLAQDIYVLEVLASNFR
jgi:hypothetical protein